MMPKVDLSKIKCEVSRGVAEDLIKKDGTLYSNKKQSWDGLRKYVWRMVMFQVSSKRSHQSIPLSAEFDLMDYLEETSTNILPLRQYKKLSEEDKKYYTTAYEWLRNKERRRSVDQIVDDIVDAIPKNQWHGVWAWGRAMGKL